MDTEGKICWFEWMDATDAFVVMHEQWRLIVDQLLAMKLDGRLSEEMFCEITKYERNYLILRFPQLHP